MTNEELFILGDYDTLYSQNVPFMYKFINRFRNLPIEKDDFIGCCNLAFMKAVKSYDPSASKWLTYFSRLMVNEILMFNRRLQKHTRCISLETMIIAIDDNTDITLEDQISSGECIEEDVLDHVMAQQILELTKMLSTREQEALKLHLMGVKQAIIGERLNISQAYVSRLIKQISNELYKQYEKGA